MIKEHFVEAFCQKGVPRERELRRAAAEEALQVEELWSLRQKQAVHIIKAYKRMPKW